MDLIDTLTIDEVFEIAEKLYENYHNEINSIEMDITKTRVF
jgi:hypothetical protein